MEDLDFSEPDGPENLVTDSQGDKIKAATFAKLVEKVTQPKTGGP